ncbi:MAG: hypothetical protein KTR14_06160 [Vampirovibrio sp.]|nr:hypothetical protein [Vampirovibrio sp.]
MNQIFNGTAQKRPLKACLVALASGIFLVTNTSVLSFAAQEPFDQAPVSVYQSAQPLPPEEVPVPSKGTTDSIDALLEPILEMEPLVETQKTPVAPSRAPMKARAVVVDIDSNTLNYNEEKDVYTATGHVHVIISEQNSELIADKVTYDQNQSLLVAEGHVVIIKHGERTEGTYAKIDLTRESALINDTATAVEMVRVKANNSFVESDYVHMQDGKIIIKPDAVASLNRGFGFGGQRAIDFYDPNSGFSLPKDAGKKVLRKEKLDLSKTGAIEKADTTGQSSFRLKIKEVTVKREADGFNRIHLKSPSLYWKNFKLASIPGTEFGYDEENKKAYYLGPDVGYDLDYGGLYWGPGWDFRVGKGVLKLSPTITYGNARQRQNGGQELESKGAGPGLGGLLSYQSPTTSIVGGYNTRGGQFAGLARRRVFTDNTQVKLAMNQNYSNGFLGSERPGWLAQLEDQRTIGRLGNFQLDTFESIGLARDDFFPTNRANFFVDADDKGITSPETAGRFQLQANVSNIKPLLQVGDFANFGFNGQVALSGYSTGDHFGLLRAGPTLNLNFANRIRSSMAYYVGTQTGESPFVFDTFFQGNQNLVLNNALRINKFLTIGAQHNLNITRDNSRNDLLVGNALYVMVGPEDVKLNLAVDVIRKRSFFGINFYPGRKGSDFDFDEMRIFQPTAFNGTPGTLIRQ